MVVEVEECVMKGAVDGVLSAEIFVEVDFVSVKTSLSPILKIEAL